MYEHNLNRIQAVQNFAARIVSNRRKYDRFLSPSSSSLLLFIHSKNSRQIYNILKKLKLQIMELTVQYSTKMNVEINE